MRDEVIECPACREQMRADARKCPHCHEWAIRTEDKGPDQNHIDRIELAERRASENVRERVEKELKSRYTWIAIITAAVTGATMAAFVKSTAESLLTKATDQVKAAEVIQNSVNRSLDEFEKTVRKMQGLEKTAADIEGRAESQRRTVAELSAVAQQLDDKFKALTSGVLPNLPIQVQSAIKDKVQKSTGLSELRTNVDKQRYLVIVSLPEGSKLADELRNAGYATSSYKEGQAKSENSQAVWVGQNVPYEYSKEVLSLALRSHDELQYLDYNQNQNQIFLGGDTKAAQNEGCLPLSKDEKFWERLKNISSQGEWRAFVDSFKKVTATRK